MIYLNFDLETGGRRPDTAPMLSFGAVAIRSGVWESAGELSFNLWIPEKRIWEPDYRQWWDSQPKEVFEACRVNPVHPWWGMNAIMDWILHFTAEGERIAFVANPVAYDMPILRSYLMDFAGAKWSAWAEQNKAGLGGVDLPTMSMMLLGRDYPDSSRSRSPKEWFPKQNTDLPHIAIEDARIQAHWFVSMMKEAATLPKVQREPYDPDRGYGDRTG